MTPSGRAKQANGFHDMVLVMEENNDQKLDRFEANLDRFVTFASTLADREVVFHDLLETLAKRQVMSLDHLNTLIDRQLITQEHVNTLIDRQISAQEQLNAHEDEMGVVKQSLAEIVEAQKRSEESINILIRMMDEWIRNNSRK